MPSQILDNGVEHKDDQVIINVGVVDKLLAAAWEEAWENYNAAGYTYEQAFDENLAYWTKADSVSGASSDGDISTGTNATDVTTAPNSPGDTGDNEVSCKETVVDNEFNVTDPTLWPTFTLGSVFRPKKGPTIKDDAPTAIGTKAWKWPLEPVAQVDQGNSISAVNDVPTIPITTLGSAFAPKKGSIIKDAPTAIGSKTWPGESDAQFGEANSISAVNDVPTIPITIETPTLPVAPETELAIPVSTTEDETEEAVEDEEGEAAIEVPVIPGPFIHNIVKAKKGAKNVKTSVPAPPTTQTDAEEPPKMAKRCLVTVRKIAEVCDLPDYPDQVLVKFDGWQVVAPRSMGFERLGAIVFFEPDSFLPFSSLHPQTTYKGKKGYLVGTKKYGKQFSQGHIDHMKSFYAIKNQKTKWMCDLMQNDEDADRWDYSEEVGVVKFTLEGVKAEEQLGRFPVWLKDASMERVQNLPITFNHRKYEQDSMRYQETVKLDGSTMTCYHIAEDHFLHRSLPQIPEDNTLPYFTHSGRFGVCSRNCDLKYRDDSVFWKAARHYRIRHLLARLNMNIAIQGELVGSTINGNHQNYKDGEHEFFVFGIWDIDAQERWGSKKVVDFCRENGLKHVPVLGYVKLPDVGRSAEDFLARAGGREGEGLVYKGIADGRWFKVISPDWEMRTQFR